MRCDLHVHSRYSGPADLPVLRHVGRECYSEPEAVYEPALRRGMDLVTLTDHDSIEGALRLAHLPDTFVSEELTLHLDGGRQLHLGVFDITREAARGDPGAAARPGGPLRLPASRSGIPACVNHLFSALTGARVLADLQVPLGRLPLIEALNGSQPEGHNEHARRVGRHAGMAPVGGSDSHTLAGVARAYTEVAGARDAERLPRRPPPRAHRRRRPLGHLCPVSPAEVTRIFAAGYHDAARQPSRDLRARARRSLGLLPLLPLIPVVTAFIHVHELRVRGAALPPVPADVRLAGGERGPLPSDRRRALGWEKRHERSRIRRSLGLPRLGAPAGLAAPPLVPRLMISATRAGDGWLWLAVGLALAAGGSDGHRVLAAAAVSAGLANILQVLVKRRVRRTRPCDCELVSRNAYGVKPLGHFPSDRYSFPSGHALERLRHRLRARPRLPAAGRPRPARRRERRRLARGARAALPERRARGVAAGGPDRRERLRGAAGVANGPHLTHTSRAIVRPR